MTSKWGLFFSSSSCFSVVRHLFDFSFTLLNASYMHAGLRKNQDSFSTWSTLRKKCRLVNGKKLKSIYQGLPKLTIIDIQWKYSLKLGSRNIWKHLIGIWNFVSFWVLFLFLNESVLVINLHILFCLWCFFKF